MSKRYKIRIRFKRPHKVNQFAYDPEIEEDDSNTIDEKILIDEPSLGSEPQLNELDEETTYKFLDSIYEDIKSYLNGRPLTITSLRSYFPTNYPFIDGRFRQIINGAPRNLSQKGIKFNNQLYAWPGDLALGNKKQSVWQRNVYIWTNNWVNKQRSISNYEEVPFLHDLDENTFKLIVDDLVPKIFDKNITTNLDGFDKYISTFLPKAKFQTTGRSERGDQRTTSVVPYIEFNNQKYRVLGYRQWPEDANIKKNYLRSQLHKYLENVKGAYPVLNKNKSDLEAYFPQCKIFLEYKLRDLGYAEWLQQNFSTYDYDKRSISTVELFNFLIGNNPTKNVFKLSSTNYDRFVVEDNVIKVQSPYSRDKVYQYNYWDENIVPELGRIDLLVETPNEKIAYECDGFFHYGVSYQNMNKNFAKQFLHDQMQNYFLEKVKGIKLIRRPLIGDWKKNIISLIKDDLGPLIHSPIQKAAYNNFSYVK